MGRMHKGLKFCTEYQQLPPGKVLAQLSCELN